MNKLLVSLSVFLVCILLIAGCSSTSTTTPAPSVSIPATPSGTTTASSALAPTNTPSSSPVATPSPSANAAQYGGIFNYITPNAPGTPIGWVQDGAGPSGLTMQICLEWLLNEDANGDLTPNLATSYDLNTNSANPSVTFHLRQGVKFQDGTDFNAQAVEWNLEQSKAGTLNQGVTRNWKSFNIIDNYTIRVNFSNWQNTYLRTFAALPALLVSPTAYQKNGVDWMRWHMVGTGAFSQTDFQTDVTLNTVKNNNYWDTGKPYLDGINLLYVSDPLTAETLFRSGGGDILDINGNGRIASELQALGYPITSQVGGPQLLIPDSMNADSPWSNLKVRMAAEYAIDKDALVKTFGYGFQPTAYQMVDPSSKAYVPTITGRKCDVNEAKQLLAEAGYASGFKTQIIAQNTVNQDVLVAIQSYLAKVGIHADLDFVDAAKFQSYQTGTWNNGLLFTNLLNFPNYNAVLGLWFNVPAFWFKSMKEPDGWETMLNATLNSQLPDPSLMQKCVQALYDNATAIPLYFDTSLWATTTQVHDSGLGTQGSPLSWTKQNTWLGK